MSLYFQVICACLICCQCFTAGLLDGWPSITSEIFRSEHSPLNRPMTVTEFSLMSSVSSIGAIFSTPLTGYLLDKLGRKYCCILAACIQVLAWSIIAMFNYVECMIVALAIAGVGASAFFVVPVYISEIVENSYRGTLSSGTLLVFYGMGTLCAFSLGGCVSYKTVSYISLSIASFGVLAVVLLKESPMCLMNKGRDEEAAKSIAFYRRAKVDSKIVRDEMAMLRKAFNTELEEKDTCPEEEKLKLAEEPVKTALSPLSFIRKSRSTQRAMFVAFFLATASVFQGSFAVQIFAKPLFKDAVPNLSSTLCCVLLSLVNICSGLTSAYLSDKIGRRPLMIHASTFTGLCCVLLGTQLQFHWAPHWMTALFIYVYTAGYACGAGAIPYLIVVEAFLPEVKSLMTMVIYDCVWLCCFIILFIFNPLVEIWGLGPVFFIFAVVCFATATFAHIFLPETKGMPVHVIQELFLNRRRK